MDLGPNTSNYTGYAGFSWLPMPAMSINTQLKLGTSGDGYEMVYFRRPAYKFNFFWWDKHFTVGLAANINDYNFKRDSELNTYNASAMVNFAWTNSKWSQGLRLGLNYDYFAFTLMGGFQPRHQPGFGIRYELPITDWWKVQVNALALLYSSEQKTDLGLGQYKYSTSWDGGAEIGLETQFNINRYLRLRLAYSRQQTAQYPINLFRGYLEAAY
jgi:hypothetical protein